MLEGVFERIKTLPEYEESIALRQIVADAEDELADLEERANVKPCTECHADACAVCEFKKLAEASGETLLAVKKEVEVLAKVLAK